MPTGIIKKKVEEKGFGFIALEGQEDVFFHMSACNGLYNDLQQDQQVSFDLEDSPKGKRAINVVAIAA